MTNVAPEIKARECRFAVHIPTRSSDIPDYHLVKEILHLENGETKPNVRFVKDYKRTFFVTKKPYRNHQQKKEYETFDKLHRYECTQSELRIKVAKALDKAWSNANLRQLAESPYLYGSDISSTSIIKQEYRQQWPDTVTPYRVSFFDIETDVVHGTNDPILATLVFEDTILTTAQASFVKGYSEPHERLETLLKKYLKPYMDKYQFKMDFRIVEGPVELIKEVFSTAHKWSPDFLAIWNMDFDIPRIIETLEKYGVDPKTIFSDPKLPAALQFCKYKKGSTKKVTASGQVKPKNPSEQWHSLYCPAGFYVIDAMCTYRFVRQGEQEEPDYKLDSILNKELGVRKLTFEEANDYHELEWHKFMQERYPFEYIVYNIFDCVGMLELENKTTDLSQALPVQCDITDFARYNSQTKRFADRYHFFLLERGKVISTIPPAEEKDPTTEADGEEDSDEVILNADDDEDISKKNEVLGLRNWIVTLPAHMTVLGRRCIAENPNLHTLIRGMVYDSDAVSAYPSCTAAANVSRETTVREIIDILDVDETAFRRHNINLLQGHVNALEYACEMHNLPTPQNALQYFEDLV